MKTRPTTDFAKEALFNILTYKTEIQNAVVYDLFSGSGNITFEFISRGAEMVYSVDISIQSQNLISKCAKEFDVGNQLRFIRADVWKLAKNLKVKADIIFADPPFTLEDYLKLHNLIFANRLLNAGGILVIEHPEKADFSGLEFFEETKTYGNINFSFFRYE